MGRTPSRSSGLQDLPGWPIPHRCPPRDEEPAVYNSRWERDGLFYAGQSVRRKASYAATDRVHILPAFQDRDQSALFHEVNRSAALEQGALVRERRPAIRELVAEIEVQRLVQTNDTADADSLVLGQLAVPFSTPHPVPGAN